MIERVRKTVSSIRLLASFHRIYESRQKQNETNVRPDHAAYLFGLLYILNRVSSDCFDSHVLRGIRSTPYVGETSSDDGDVPALFQQPIG